jgi:hypothetical protein
MRKTIKATTVGDSAVPKAAMLYSAAVAAAMAGLPNRSEIGPTSSAPPIDPNSAEPTTTPFSGGLRCNAGVTNSSAPAMTPSS